MERMLSVSILHCERMHLYVVEPQGDRRGLALLEAQQDGLTKIALSCM